MTPRPALLALLTGLCAAGAILWLGPSPEPVEALGPRARMPDSVGPPAAQEPVAADPALPFAPPSEAAGKVSLASVPIEEEVEPENGRAGIVLVRWPDEEPLAEVDVQIFGDPGPTLGTFRTSKKGRIDFDLALAPETLRLHVRAPGYEALQTEVGPFETRVRLPRLGLRPLEGWYGRVVSVTEGPAAGVPVGGWWMESPRPFADHELKARRRLAALEAELRELEPSEALKVGNGGSGEGARDAEGEAAQAESEELTAQIERLRKRLDTEWQREETREADAAEENGSSSPAPTAEDLAPVRSDFIAARGALRATALTDGDGYFYIAPLEADIHGEMVLHVPGQEASTEVLRVPLPHAHGRLPDLVLHRPLELHGTVVDGTGAPVADAVVIPLLASGWSPPLEPVRSDADGRFTLNRPGAPLLLAVECLGYGLTGDTQGRPESADGLWDTLAEITPEGRSTASLFDLGYADMAETLLPRTRQAVAVDPWQSDIRLELKRRSIGVQVNDATAGPFVEPGIAGARVIATYGGVDVHELELETDGRGSVTLPGVDVQWQPLLVRVEAAGFRDQFTVVSRPDAPLVFHLHPADEARSGDAGVSKAEFTGIVTGLGPGERAELVAYTSATSKAPLSPSWRGKTDAGGAFDIPEGPLSRRSNHYLFAYTEDSGLRRAGVQGPFHASGPRTLELALEPAQPMALHVGDFDEGTPHRVLVRMAPFPGAEDAFLEYVELPASASWRSSHTVEAPFGWTVRAMVERQLEGNVPIIDYLRPDRRQRAYASLRTTWTDWVPASDVRTLSHAYRDANLFVEAPSAIDLSGTVTGLPYDPPPLYAAALGRLGHWIAPVDGNGWFEFRGLPSGSYRILVYTPREGEVLPGEAAPLELDGRGRVLGSRSYDCLHSRHDLLVPFEAYGD